ncbi:hypothetical protein MBLNU230_g6424t1 [Neophaeotheca triangularis]
MNEAGYHRPRDPDTPYDDNDSDLDLDLNELDPQPAGSSGRYGESADSKRSPNYSRGIPLGNLRNGGRRRRQDDGDEDGEALLSGGDEEAVKRKSVASSGLAEDDAPLLSAGSSSRRRPDYDLPEPRRKRGLKRLLPFTRRTTSVHLPTDADNTALDDEPDYSPSSTRTISVGQKQTARFPPNAVSNAKYTPWSFLPRTLYNEFSFFFNMYFLLVALSQIIPALRIGYLSTYIAPLAFVLMITLGKEAYDDIQRRKRDNEANGETYKVLEFDERRERDVERVAKEERATMGKKRKLRRRGTPDGDGRISQMEDEEQRTEHVKAPSASVREVVKPSRDLKVGDVVVLEKDRRVPADVVILKSFAAETGVSAETVNTDKQFEPVLFDAGQDATAPDDEQAQGAVEGADLDNKTTSEDPGAGGEAFIRTDQLDGETDWKLRLASPLCQTLPTSEFLRLQLSAGKPDKKVNDFVGTMELLPKHTRGYDPPTDKSRESGAKEQQAENKSSPLSIDNTAWANTVLASSTTVYAVVVYTGPQTRAALSTSASRSKTGLLELEINSLVKILCIITAALSFLLVALEGFDNKNDRPWYVAVMRFLILFSTIVPISLRVNLDMGKSVYAYFIQRDSGIPGTVVRTSTIPEDLGRIEYLLSDKTGTLTRNEMELRKVHVGTVSYNLEAMEEVASFVKQAFVSPEGAAADQLWTPSTGLSMMNNARGSRREISLRVRDLVLALALCHNVTPTVEEEDGKPVTAYQASSPDEIAIVQWTEQVGLRLVHRDRKTISLQFASDGRTVVKAKILNVFPFTSDSKRMGIVVKFIRNANSDEEDDEVYFYQKGADTVMSAIVASNDWLDEETGNMAREGLRTLVIGRKTLSPQQYSSFAAEYSSASMSFSDRDSAMQQVVNRHLESSLELLGVTGVEDKLQDKVKPSLELLRNAGIKIWMLTGDKVETARCVAVSSKLVSRGQYIHTISGLTRKEAALDALSLLHSQPTSALLIDGQSLSLYLTHHRDDFITLAVRLPAVVACRCSPTQKADIAHLIRAYTRKRIACIGDGGNDVSMIQAADVGVGIVGKEGRQASLAADFSITQFSHLAKLLLWHGRNSYKRSAKLSQFVIHRGLLISVAQTVFSVASAFEPIALYRDWLLVGYATVYTMAPVFSLVLDRDVDEHLANLYPELYKDLHSAKSLSYTTFFTWLAISIYQGLIIQGGSELLVPSYSRHPPTSSDPLPTPDTNPGFSKMLAVSYTSLVINELIMVAAEVTTWHPVMIFSLLGTAGVYFGSLPFLGEYFDRGFLLTLGFAWRVVAICAASLVPVWGGKVVRDCIKPPSYRKVRGV